MAIGTRSLPQRGPRSLAWLLVSLGVAALANAVAGVTTTATIGLMASVSDFAVNARGLELNILPYYRAAAYLGIAAFVVWYVWPLVCYFRQGCPQPAEENVRRTAVNFPVIVAFGGLSPWLLSLFVYPLATLIHLGHWTTDLMSQQILSPLVNGFFAATLVYLVVDWISRRMVIPHVFPSGGIADVRGSAALGVRARLLVFLAAVAFIPLFTMLGLTRSAAVRFESGVPVDEVVHGLAAGSTAVFFVYAGLGLALALILARTFTLPLAEVARALRRVQAGYLDVSVEVEASDEIGRLQDGLNQMVAGLREKDRILQTFGRVVEPAIRDHLLSGDLALGGTSRKAVVLFCDLRGFTAMAERLKPDEVVETLNEFFNKITAWVRESGGFVDKFIGDALLVVFGLFDDDDGALTRGCAQALDCALGVRGRLDEINDQRGLDGRPRLSVGMGIHAGEVLAGTIGAADRHEYTVIGDTVNVAARLQELCKEGPRDLLVSRLVWEEAARGGVNAEVARHDRVEVRGRREPVAVCEIA